MIRLLFIVNGFAIGGGELKVLELVRELRNDYPRQFIPFVCAIGQGGPLEKEFINMGIEPYIYHKHHKYDISLIWRLISLIQNEKIDVLQTTLFYADVIGTIAGKMAGVPHIISWEAITQPYEAKHLLAYRLASQWFSCSVAVSHAIRTKVIKERHLSPKKAMAIQYGVDLQKFIPERNYTLRKVLGISPKDIIFGTVARFSEQKGHRYLIKAAREVYHQNPNCHFVLVGDGPLREETEKQVRLWGLESCFHFLGFRDDVNDLLNVFDVFVLPSLYEGLPNVVLEAMACGKPVIASAVDGTPEAVKHGETGLLIPSKDSAALRDAMFEMLNNRTQMKMMGKQGRKRVEAEFNLKKQVSEFVDLYERLYSSRR